MKIDYVKIINHLIDENKKFESGDKRITKDDYETNKKTLEHFRIHLGKMWGRKTMRRNYHKVSKIVTKQGYSHYERKFRKNRMPKNRRVLSASGNNVRI